MKFHSIFHPSGVFFFSEVTFFVLIFFSLPALSELVIALSVRKSSIESVV
jgi:hypothetical protein